MRSHLDTCVLFVHDGQGCAVWLGQYTVDSKWTIVPVGSFQPILQPLFSPILCPSDPWNEGGGQLAAFVPVACLEVNRERLKSLIKEDTVLFTLRPLPGGHAQVLTSIRWRVDSMQAYDGRFNVHPWEMDSNQVCDGWTRCKTMMIVSDSVAPQFLRRNLLSHLKPLPLFPAHPITWLLTLPLAVNRSTEQRDERFDERERAAVIFSDLLTVFEVEAVIGPRLQPVIRADTTAQEQ
ncbi:hypothetical protein DNTS_021713, partial [Danionella cerebrum]